VLLERVSSPLDLAEVSRASSALVSTKKKKRKKRAVPGAPTTRSLYIGMSGQFVAMSEFLWRGYNVALPAVDVGDDVFVVEAESGILRRVQVKTAGTGTSDAKNGTKTVQFKLSRAQLNLSGSVSELFFMLLARWDDVDRKIPWRFILLRSNELNRMRLTRPAGMRGRQPAPDSPNESDVVQMKVVFSETDATTWGQSLAGFLDRWSPDWPVTGPMKGAGPAVRLAAQLGTGAPPAATLAAVATTTPAAQPHGGNVGPGTTRS